MFGGRHLFACFPFFFVEEEAVRLLGLSDPPWLAFAPVLSRLDFEVSADGGFAPQACGGAAGVTWYDGTNALAPASLLAEEFSVPAPDASCFDMGHCAVRAKVIGRLSALVSMIAHVWWIRHRFVAVGRFARIASVFGFFAASFARYRWPYRVRRV